MLTRSETAYLSKVILNVIENDSVLQTVLSVEMSSPSPRTGSKSPLTASSTAKSPGVRSGRNSSGSQGSPAPEDRDKLIRDYNTLKEAVEEKQKRHDELALEVEQLLSPPKNTT
jgi:hypothetical protein